MSLIVHQDYRRRKGSKHDRNGCLTCRYRRKKCTENSFPVCGACSRLNLECIRQPSQDVIPTSWGAHRRQTDRDVKPTEQSPLSAGIHTSVYRSSSADSPQKRHAMRYYISVLTTHLTVSHEFNSFLTAFLPMAMESVALFSVLLALGTAHISLTDASQHVAALETRSSAIRSLSTSLSAPSNELAYHETNAAACLAFVIYEAGVGDCKAWYTHLKGTHHVIASTSVSFNGKLLKGPEAFKISTEGQWILRNFAYHDILGSVTLRRKPLLDCDYLDGITDVVDSCVGVAAGLLRILARISCLDEDTRQQDPLSEDDKVAQRHDFQDLYIQLEQELLSWMCQPGTPPGLAALAYAYRNASLVILYRLMRNRLTSGYLTALTSDDLVQKATTATEAKIQAQISDTLQHISDIPSGTAPEAALLFPIFMIGGEVLEEGQIDAVRSRLQMMADKRQFRNLWQARKILEELWELRRTSNGVDVDWTHILDATGSDLLLT